jgi:glycosyltransferase involved in cell wall biosynthesis
MRGDEISIPAKRIVLFVTNSYSYGGSEKHLLDLLGRIDDKKIQTMILCTDSDPFTERLNQGFCSTVIVRTEKSLDSMKDWVRIFREIKPDAVVLVYGTLWLLPWFAALAARLAGVQKLYAIQHLMPQSPPDSRILEIKSPRDLARRIFGKRARKLLGARLQPHLCKMTICVSNAVRDALIQGYGFPQSKIRTVHNGISVLAFAPRSEDRESIRRRLEISPKDFLLICTARLSIEKGIDILLLAMKEIIQKCSICKCIVIGEGPLKEKLIEQIETAQLGSHVFLEGFQADVRAYLAAADAFVLTSHIEGLPYSILEAMASGLPCIVTNVGGNAEAVINNVTGFVVKSGSVEDVVQAILYLLNNPKERARMAERSQSRANKEFDIEAKIAEITQIILT